MDAAKETAPRAAAEDKRERLQRAGRLMRRHGGSVLFGIFRFVVLFGLIFLILYPFIFMIITAFRSEVDLQDPTVVWITRHYTLDNFRTFLSTVDFGDMMSMTVIISLGSAILQTFIGGLAGYGFARFKFRGRNVLFGLLLFTIIVPPQTIMMQLFVLFRYFNALIFAPVVYLSTGSWTLNLINTPFPNLILALFGMGLRSGLFIYIYRQFYRGLPRELEEAARIDGSGAIGTYFRVMLPNARAAMVTVFMLSFVWNWNDAYTQSYYLMSRNTVAIYLSGIHENLRSASALGEDPTYLYILIQAGALLCILPLILLFLFGQKYFTESMERTGIVG